MTPEEVELRLRSLQTPSPPERLRERCLTARPRSARPRAALAIAASFLVVALTVWLVSTSGPAKVPDRILPPQAEEIPAGKDPVLQDKTERLLQRNPGKGILVVRVKELSDGTFRPVTRGFWLKILLHPAERESDPLRNPDGPSANVDLDGTLLFVASPGNYLGVGYQDSPTEALKKLSFVWEYKDVSVKSGEVVILADAVFAPWMEWAGPVERGELSLKADAGISWAAYPELRGVRIGIERVTEIDGISSWTTLGILRRECPKENSIPLSDLQKGTPTPFRAGEMLALSLEGYDRDGKKLTGCKTKRLFTLKE